MTSRTTREHCAGAIREILDLTWRLMLVYPVGVNVAEANAGVVRFSVRYTTWEVYNLLVRPHIEQMKLPCVCQVVDFDSSYGGEIEIKIDIPDFARGPMNTVRYRRYCGRVSETDKLETLATSLQDTVRYLESERSTIDDAEEIYDE